MPDVAVQQFHVEQGLGDHRKGAHTHRHAKEQREDGRIGASGHERPRQQETGGDAEAQGQEQTCDADFGRGEAAPTDQGEVHLGSGDANQQHAQLADRIQQLHLRCLLGQQPAGEVGQ